MPIGKNKLGDQIVPKSEQQKHKHADTDKHRKTKSDKPVREEEKQAVGFQDQGDTRVQQTPD